MPLLRTCLASAVVLLVSACGGGKAPGPTAAPPPSSTSSSPPSSPPSSTSPPPPLSPPSSRFSPTGAPDESPARATQVTKLMVVMVENHSLDQMRDQLPFTFDLAQRYGYATGYAALTHPSLPNYLAIAGGSTFGIADDNPPDANPVDGSSVFGQALAAGRSATVYAEGMPFGCAQEDGGERYGVRHNPWAYFVDERSACEEHDTTLDQLRADTAAGDLPNAGMLIPDTCHDAHDCDASAADAWLRTELPLLMSGPDWSAGRLAIVVTADEDDHSQGNLVLTAVLHPSVRGVVVDEPLTHYSLTRLYDEVLGVSPLRSAGSAPSMAEAFGLPVAGLS